MTPQEFTFGRSLNLGISQSVGEFLVFASAHVYPVYPDWLEKLLSPFTEPGVGLVYGKQRGDSVTLFSEQQIFAQWFPDQPLPRQSHPFCNNANAAVRRALWQERSYDENLPALEDLDWAHWVMGKGYLITYVPEAEIVHVHLETPRGVYNRYRREAMAFKRIFPSEHFHLADLVRLIGVNVFSDIRQALRQGVLSASLKSIIWFRCAQFWGTYQGYRHSGPLTWQLRQTFYYPPSGDSTIVEKSRMVEPIRYHDAS